MGRKREALRAKYWDTTRYAIVRSTLAPVIGAAVGQHAARVEGLLIEDVSVPRPLRKSLNGLSQQDVRSRAHETCPRFEATVSFGRRLEPWLASIRPR